MHLPLADDALAHVIGQDQHSHGHSLYSIHAALDASIRENRPFDQHAEVTAVPGRKPPPTLRLHSDGGHFSPHETLSSASVGHPCRGPGTHLLPRM